MEANALRTPEFSSDTWGSLLPTLPLSAEAQRVATFLISVLRYEASVMSWQIRKTLQLSPSKTKVIVDELLKAEFIIPQPCETLQRTYILNRRLPGKILGGKVRTPALPGLRLVALEGKLV